MFLFSNNHYKHIYDVPNGCTDVLSMEHNNCSYFPIIIINIFMMLLMESTHVLSIWNIIIVFTFCYKHAYYVPNGYVQMYWTKIIVLTFCYKHAYYVSNGK